MRSTTLERLFATYGIPYFVKIDVEGYEVNVLRGLNRPVRFLSFEVNLPEFRPEGVQCLDLLATLCEAGRFNYALDCQSGLALDEWVSINDFEHIFKECTAGVVEVFWKTPEGSNKSILSS